MVEIPPALTLWRPWSTLILQWGKTVENRDWYTSYRGPLLIHGGKTWDYEALSFCWRIGSSAVEGMSWDHADHPTGFVGVADLTDVCQAWRKRCDTLGCEPWGVRGSDHFQLANPAVFSSPIPCRGKQQLWRPPEDTHDAIRKALAEVGRGA